MISRCWNEDWQDNSYFDGFLWNYCVISNSFRIILCKKKTRFSYTGVHVMKYIGSEIFYTGLEMGDSIWHGCWRKNTFKSSAKRNTLKNILASTIPGDPFGGPAEVEKVIRVEKDEIGAKTFFWLVLYRVTLLEDQPRSKKWLELKWMRLAWIGFG